MDQDFHNRLLTIFRTEAKEHLGAISAGLFKLEQLPAGAPDPAVIEGMFREAHSLKGAARAVNLTGVETVSHTLESVFAALKRREINSSVALFDLLHQALDAVTRVVGGEGDALEKGQFKTLVQRLGRAAQGGAGPAVPPPVHRDEPPPRLHERHATEQTVRIAAAKLDDLLNQAEELVAAKLAIGQRVAELGELDRTLAEWEKEWKKSRPGLGGIRSLRRSPGLAADCRTGEQAGTLLDFLDRQHSFIRQIRHRVQRTAQAIRKDRHALGQMVDALHEEAREVLMLPFATLGEILPKAVRDLARDLAKDAVLVQSGDSVAIDKRILEGLKDPLLHLVRNCVAHGIESPAERQRWNKPPRGTVSVAVALAVGNRMEITVADDGAGVDLARIKGAALKAGLVTGEEAAVLSDDDALQLLFRSGLSTSPMITDVSGRGLGLAIVREKVEELGGTVSVTAAPQQGTSFRLVLPLTLSTFRGVLVQEAEQVFVLPATRTERVGRVAVEGIQTVEGRDAVVLGGEAVSFVRLADVLGLPRAANAEGAGGMVPFFLLVGGERRIAFGVDRVLDEQEVMVKGLGPQLARVRNLAGATVLGTGSVVPILHCDDLLQSAVRVSAAARPAVSATVVGEEAQRAILVAEDSITSRTLLKNILETAGYRTVTAVDGLDALMQLGMDAFDLVVSDVDMPRMNGFELTAKLRATGKFAELPMVLVTSLDSREDRERGIEVGANAYIVKSSFDQSNLLEVIRRLL